MLDGYYKRRMDQDEHLASFAAVLINNITQTRKQAITVEGILGRPLRRNITPALLKKDAQRKKRLEQE